MRSSRTFALIIALAPIAACNAKTESSNENVAAAPAAAAALAVGQSNVKDEDSQKDVVKIALGSADHTTLVAALKAADLVNSLSNAGPFTVFAPTNAAFDKLPKGTVEELLKPENINKLRAVLQHHVTVSVFEPDQLTDGLELSMADGKSAKISHEGSTILIDGAKIVASVRGSNGIVHVIDGVVLAK